LPTQLNTTTTLHYGTIPYRHILQLGFTFTVPFETTPAQGSTVPYLNIPIQNQTLPAHYNSLQHISISIRKPSIAIGLRYNTSPSRHSISPSRYFSHPNTIPALPSQYRTVEYHTKTTQWISAPRLDVTQLLPAYTLHYTSPLPDKTFQFVSNTVVSIAITRCNSTAHNRYVTSLVPT